MGNFFSATSIVALIACSILGCLYAWLMYGANRSLPKPLKATLAGLRILLVTLIAFLLFAPLVKLISYQPEKPIIVIANDNSISAATVNPAGFDKENYQKNLKKLADQLSSKYEVKTVHFSDSVKAGLDFTGNGKLTDISALFRQLNDELMNRNVGAVILASDGIFNRGGNPLYEINQIKAPVYTIALGDTIARKDVRIANVNYNNLVYLDNEFTLDMEVQAFQSKGAEVQLSVSENGKKIKELPIRIDANSFVRNIPVKLKAGRTGVQQYSLHLSPIKNEITTRNNSQTVFVEVIDARQKILLAAAAPHPDLAILRQAIEGQKHYEVTVALADELNGQELQHYSLVILHQLPDNNPANLSLLRRLQESKVPLWYILGAQSNFNAFNQLQKSVDINRGNNSLQEIFPYKAPDFTLFNLAETAFSQLGDYDPLLFPFSNLSVNGNYTAILNQRIGKINTQNPLWFFMEDNGRKSGFLVGEGIWKWKLEEAKNNQNFPLVNELISRSIQYLAAKDDKRKFKVYSSKSTYDENENIVLNATLYNDSYEAVNTPDVEAQVKNAAGKVYNYTFSRSGSTYRLDAGTLPQGNYTYMARTSLGNKTYTASGAFYVNALIAEYQQTTANHQLLQTMAQQSGGKLYAPAQLLTIAEELEKSGLVKTVSYEDRKYEELISLKWLFFLLVSLLATEWFLRKRNGEN